MSTTYDEHEAQQDDYDLVEMAWVIIANVSEGDWTKQPHEWRDAALRWRDQYHIFLEHGSPAVKVVKA